VSYENIGRFSSASQTYKRIYSDYPDSDFADDALLRTGFNHSRFFEYEEAVASYKILAEEERYKDSEHRTTALKNSAQLLDSLQEYDRSSEMYKKFAEKSEDKNEAAEARFKAAEVLGKTDDHRKTIAAYQTYLNAHSGDTTEAERVVQAHLRIGQQYAALGNENKAEEYYRATVAAFETRGLKPASDAAAAPSEAQFLLANKTLDRVKQTKLKSTQSKALERESKALIDAVISASAEFNKVQDYKVVEWALAATFSKGKALEEAAINFNDAPVPKKLKQYSEPWFAYKDIVGQAAQVAEGKALAEYEATLKLAKHYNVENEWTRAARERLNIYKPDEYPLLRQPALDLEVQDLR
jgi:TolA-binding protein